MDNRVRIDVEELDRMIAYTEMNGAAAEGFRIVRSVHDKYVDAGHSYRSMLYGAAMRQGDLDWLGWVNTCFTVAIYGHQNEIYDAALEEFFGVKPPERKPGFPPI